MTYVVKLVAVSVLVCSCAIGDADSADAQVQTASQVSYIDFQRNPKKYVGAVVSWLGSQMAGKITTDAAGNEVREYTYLSQGAIADSSAGPFVLVDSIANTPAADSLDRVPGDPGLRLVTGTVREIRSVTLQVGGQARQFQAPVLTRVRVDAPPASAATP